MQLFEGEELPFILVRGKWVKIVIYGFVDALGLWLVSLWETAEGIKYIFGNWGSDMNG